ncbi:MAG: hypothetical protein WBM99_02745 [Psychromonas sp.]
MNKQLFDYSKRLVLKYRQGGVVKLNASLSKLHSEHGFGTLRDGYLHFNDDQRMGLIRDVQLILKRDLLTQEYATQSRQDNAKHNRNEKNNSYAVSRDFVLINSLGNLQLNGQVIPTTSITSLGLYVKAQEIESIQHKQIVFVENLEIMANLPALILPEQLDNPLWLYRGDIQAKQQTGTAYEFFKRFADQQLICFSDLDPAGIQIALTCNAEYWLTAKDSAVIDFKQAMDAEREWDKQSSAINYLKHYNTLPAKCQSAFDLMLSKRKTLKQEHMLARQIELGLYKL